MNEFEFQKQLHEAADKAVNDQANGVAHVIRQAFFAGVAFEMERRRQERINGPKTSS